jgi:predicted nucleotidyltransferase
MPSPTLTDRQRGILRAIFAPYADKIERVAVFGSRATGKARANSDIDLVIYGSVDEKSIGRMAGLCEESALEVSVDLVAYPLISYAPFKEHIDAVALTLFTHDVLKKGGR